MGYETTKPLPGDQIHDTQKKILQQLRAGIPIANPIEDVGVLGEVETLAHEHAHVHDGSSFLASDMQTMSQNTSYRYALSVPSGTLTAHFFWRVTTTSQFYIELFESPTTVTGGTPLTALNRNRNSVNGPILTITKGVSAVADGTRMLVERVGSGTVGTRVGGNSQQIEEWLLKPGLTYLFHVRCETAGAVAVQMQWYQDVLGAHES